MESVVTVLTSLFLFTGLDILKPTCEHDMLVLHFVFLSGDAETVRQIYSTF